MNVHANLQLQSTVTFDTSAARRVSGMVLLK